MNERAVNRSHTAIRSVQETGSEMVELHARLGKVGRLLEATTKLHNMQMQLNCGRRDNGQRCAECYTYGEYSHIFRDCWQRARKRKRQERSKVGSPTTNTEV
ncbi:hypothetical protein HPB48_001193 [Haemaphysalis longicornis]|uniref:CCHC-type domain-containing protein n=1 Tax=Haemaphysalis longicornis TaxID=44386 RepID=A0A9J6F909_HAELO|nr:hypothetical protein HPB48_001193 [Haemaphysalis longicornis]